MFIKITAKLWLEYALDFQLFGQTFDHLNIVFDYRIMLGDGPGAMFAYAPKYGLVRMTQVDYLYGYAAIGWDVLPE